MWPDAPAIVAQVTEDVLKWYNWKANVGREYEEVK